MSKEFGERLLSLLKKQGITQKQLADRLNTTEATLSRYVNGDREPKADMLANIATALNTTSDYLLGIEKSDYN
ncbi:MAG: helix-turn-helix transcriptional regulator, partial [Clostridiales bacterium]|nr:helix-turn-helix transcriptional regulator [Clostridiales bacterium]